MEGSNSVPIPSLILALCLGCPPQDLELGDSSVREFCLQPPCSPETEQREFDPGCKHLKRAPLSINLPFSSSSTHWQSLSPWKVLEIVAEHHKWTQAASNSRCMQINVCSVRRGQAANVQLSNPDHQMANRNPSHHTNWTLCLLLSYPSSLLSPPAFESRFTGGGGSSTKNLANLACLVHSEHPIPNANLWHGRESVWLLELYVYIFNLSTWHGHRPAFVLWVNREA